MYARPRRQAGAFTLIELLVVVAIIALLISILLPSLAAARAVAKRIRCGANMSQIGKAMQGYATEEKEWIVGAPNGSGFPAALLGISEPDYAASGHEAATAYDFINPLLKTYLGFTEIPSNRFMRMAQSREGIFLCPENKELSVPYPVADVGSIAVGPDGVNYAVQRASSYLTMWKFLFVGGFRAGKFQARNVEWAGYPGTENNGESQWETQLPGDYLPKISKVGLTARKVYLMDGTRYVTDSGKIDYDFRRGIAGRWGAGGYSSSGPVYKYSVEYGFRENSNQKRAAYPLSYRHRSASGFGANSLFFDGHVQYQTDRESREVAAHSPTGSTFTGNSEVHPEAENLYEPGDVITD